MSNILMSAAYQAIQIWMENNIDFSYASSTVAFDMAIDGQKPAMSLGGLVLIPILVGLDIMILLLIAVGNIRNNHTHHVGPRRWTHGP